MKRIKRQALEMNFFDKIILMTEFNLEKKFRKKMKDYLTPGALHLCAWKPQVIMQMLLKMQEGDLMLYADSGCHLNKMGRKRLIEYFQIASDSKTGILATQLEGNMKEREWTKGDVFRYLNVTDKKKITETNQIQAGILIIRKNHISVKIVQEWLKIITNQPKLIKRDYFESANLSGFKEHRSDQSIFSILAKLNGINLISANEVHGSSNWERDMIEYPIWAMRDKEYDFSFWANPSIRRLFSGIKRRLIK